MFFVGATGQLLTLILTVCLPFVFLFSAQPKAKILNDSLIIAKHEINHQVTNFENISFDIQIESIENQPLCYSDLKDPFLKKPPCDKLLVKWKSFHLDSSGNKAPPCTILFAC